MFDSREEFVLWYDVIVQVINMDVFEEDDLKENFLYESEDSGGYIWKRGVDNICIQLIGFQLGLFCFIIVNICKFID